MAYEYAENEVWGHVVGSPRRGPLNVTTPVSEGLRIIMNSDDADYCNSVGGLEKYEESVKKYNKYKGFNIEYTTPYVKPIP